MKIENFLKLKSIFNFFQENSILYPKFVFVQYIIRMT